MDSQFGTIIELDPTDRELISEAEAQSAPGPSHIILDATTAPTMLNYMGQVPSANRLVRTLNGRIVFLWTIDASGMIHVALEEYVEANSLTPVSFRPMGLPPTIRDGRVNLTRLGHPSLAPDFQARIGGELYFDESDDSWNLSTGSRRFGYVPGRTQQHLKNACALFASFGISVDPDYIPPR